MTESAHDIQILKNFLREMPRRYRRGTVNWVVVQTLLLQGTDHSGSTSAGRKCHELGIDPDGFTLPTFEEIKERSK